MNLFAKSVSPGRDLVPSGALQQPDREELRAWIQMLLREATELRAQAAHINKVATDADEMADRVETVLRTL